MNASALIARNRAAEGVPLARRAVQLAENAKARPGDLEIVEKYAKSLRSLGLTLQNQKGAKDESIPVWEKLIGIYGELLRREPSSVARQRDLAMAHRVMASSENRSRTIGRRRRSIRCRRRRSMRHS